MKETEDIQFILQENEKRKAMITAPYHPKTGEGCVSVPRKLLTVEDFPQTKLYLPVEMWEKEDVVKELAYYGSLKAYTEAKKIPLTQEIYYHFVLEFNERRSKYDFEYYALTRIKIKDKLTGQMVPFILNRGQRRLLQVMEEMRINRVPIRIILLKARQWGGSTLVQMYFFWVQTILAKGLSSSICAHVQDASRNILSMFSNAVANYPKIPYQIPLELTPKEGMQNARNIEGRECSITVGSAIKPDSIRSQSVHMAHFSEIGLYPTTANNNPKDLIESVSSIIPNVPLSCIVYESTAKGVGNFFHTQWLRSKQGKTRFVPVFIEWFLIDIYSEPIEGDIQAFAESLTEYEQYLWSLGATLEAINWYRIKSSEMDNEDSMKQEFPSDDVEAFRLSGEMVFDRNKLEQLRKGCCNPIRKGELISKNCTISSIRKDPTNKKRLLENLSFEEDTKGKLKIWANPDRELNISHRYLVVVDAGGRTRTSDPSCICVIDRYWMSEGGSPEVVAEWHGHTDLDILAWNATQIARWYNNALLVFESNTYESKEAIFNKDGDSSEFIFSQIADVYTNLYSRTPADKIVEGVPPRYGFHTNKTTKPMIVHNYIACLRDMDEGACYIERETACIDEAVIYEKKKDGSFGNVTGTGNHDDRLMTRMIGLQICYEMPLPKEKSTKQSYIPQSVSSYGSI